MDSVILLAPSHKIGLIVIDSDCVDRRFMFIQSSNQGALRFKVFNASFLPAL